MDRFKNEHLENLWGNLLPYIGGTCTACEIADIVKLFEECAMAIEDEADDCEHWRTMYSKTCKEVDMLKETIRLQEQVIDKFRTTKTAAEKERDEYKSQYENLCKYLREWQNSKASDDFEDPQKLRTEYSSLKESLDILKKSNEALLSANMDLAREKHKLEDSLSYTMIQQLEARVEELTEQLKDANNKADRWAIDLDDAKKQLDYFTHSRNDWRARAKHAEEDVENLKKKLVELQQDYHELFEENKTLNARLNSMCEDEYIKKLQDSVRDIGYEQGQTDLWNMLEEAAGLSVNEFVDIFDDVIDVEDLIRCYDLYDFLSMYKEWKDDKTKPVSFEASFTYSTSNMTKEDLDRFIEFIKNGLDAD